MAWYRTGTIAIANGSTTVTGTGTNFIDTAAGVNAGDMLIVGAGTTLRQYEIATVNSATQLTLATAATLAVAAGSTYQIATSVSMSNGSLAKKVAAAYDRILQSIANWTTIFSGSGTVTIQNYGESQSYSGLAWPTLSALANAALTNKGNLSTLGVTDVNNLGNATDIGFYDSNNSASYSLPNIPEAQPGMLEVFIGGRFARMQRYTTWCGTVWVRSLNASWNASSPNWAEWFNVSMATVTTQSTADVNTLTSAGRYTVGSASANLPIAQAGIVEVIRYASNVANVQQTFKTQVTAAASANRIFTRTLNGGTWTAWAESLTTAFPVAVTAGGTGGATASAGWLNLLTGRTAATARSDLGLGSLATLSSVTKNQLDSDLIRGTFFSNGRNNAGGAGVWTFDQTNFGFGEQYATCIQVTNQLNSSGTAGSGIWQHYLALCTSGNIIYALNINGSYASYRIWGSRNTTVDGSGFIKQASPVARVTANTENMQPSFLESFTLAGFGSVNEEAEGVVMDRLDVGHYTIANSAGLHSDGWQIEVPKDVNGNRLCFVEVETDASNLITLKVFRPKLDLETGGIVAGVAIDIPDGKWIDLRLDMPADSIFNKRMEKINKSFETTQSTIDAELQKETEQLAAQEKELNSQIEQNLINEMDNQQTDS